MPSRSMLNVSLTPALEKFVGQRVESGLYQSASEVVREGLRLLCEREQLKKAAVARLRGELANAWEQSERGELLDGEEVFRELLSESRSAVKAGKRRRAAGRKK